MNKKYSEKYLVTVCFIDDTYWDDGSRYTHCDKMFHSYESALKFCRKVIEEKGILECSNVTNQRKFFRVTKSDIMIEKITTEDITDEITNEISNS